MTFDAQEFLDWLEEQDSYYLTRDEVEEAFPGFHRLFGAKMKGGTVSLNDDGVVQVPVRDYRDAVIHGYLKD